LEKLESERQILLANINDAEKALTTVSKDKDRLHLFVKSTEKSLEQLKKHLKLLATPDASGDASVLPVNLTNLISYRKDGGSPTSKDESSELRAARRLVALFVDIYQAAFVKMTSLQSELQANQQHVRRLKAELSDACARGGDPDSPAWHRERLTYVPYRSGSNRGHEAYQSIPCFQPLDEDSENSNMRGEPVFITPVKSRQY